MPATVEPLAPGRVSDASLAPRGRVFPSPWDWQDEILYFLLPDRFSDDPEVAAQRPAFDRANPAAHRATDKAGWMAAGKGWCGGTLRGAASRLPYLKKLGVTALWIAPVFKNRIELDTYHGYSIQDFLEIDPRFGTRQDLRDLVDAAHDLGLRVLFDIVYNHTGNNWYYNNAGTPVSSQPFRRTEKYAFHSWRSAAGSPAAAIQSRDDGVWPGELQDPDSYTRLGRIVDWEPPAGSDPKADDQEFRLGDFLDQKDLDLSQDSVLSTLIKVYQYWIALTDCDGFRIDTVKHLPLEASRNFCGAIREYCETIGKENFILLGEVAGGGELPRAYLEIFGANLDAVLDIGDAATRIELLAKGFAPPQAYFAQYTGTDDLGSHRRLGRYHISVLDDHDMVNKGGFKQRFAAGGPFPAKEAQAALAVGIQLTTLGIPCIYYGTEQAFNGSQASHEEAIEPRLPDGTLSHNDRYVREAMFGGPFGAFETAGCHFFDESHPTYLRIAGIARTRQREDGIGLALRRGRQYLREIDTNAGGWHAAGAGELAGWSRILFQTEVVVVVNPHGGLPQTAHIEVGILAAAKGSLTVLYHSDWSAAVLEGSTPPPAEELPVTLHGGRPAVAVTLPPAGMIILS
jgi:glycosidase